MREILKDRKAFLIHGPGELILCKWASLQAI